MEIVLGREKRPEAGVFSDKRKGVEIVLPQCCESPCVEKAIE